MGPRPRLFSHHTLNWLARLLREGDHSVHEVPASELREVPWVSWLLEHGPEVKAAEPATEPTASFHYVLVCLIVLAQYLAEHLYQLSLLNLQVFHQLFQGIWPGVSEHKQYIDARFYIFLFDVLDQTLYVEYFLFFTRFHLLTLRHWMHPSEDLRLHGDLIGCIFDIF